MSATRRLLIILAGLALLAAACNTSGEVSTDTSTAPTTESTPDEAEPEADDQDETPEPTPEATPEPTPEETPEPTPEETPEATPEPTPEATPEATAEATPEPTPEETPDGGASGADSEFCRAVMALDDAPNPFDTSTGSTLDADALRTSIEESINLSKQALAAAPDDMVEDIEIVIEGTEAVRDVFAAAEYDFLDVKLPDLLAVVNNRTFFDARQRLEVATEGECGIPADLEDYEETTLDDFGGTDTIRESMVDQFAQLGVEPEQAQCMADGLTLDMLSSGSFEVILDLAIECGVDPTTLS